MFSITHKPHSNPILDSLVVENPSSGFKAVLFYRYGAVVNELIFTGGRSVIRGFADVEKQLAHFYSFGSKLSPFPNRIEDGKYTWEGKDYQLDTNKSNENNAIHGLMTKAEYEITQRSCDEKKAHITLSTTYDGKRAGFPFPYKLEMVLIFEDEQFTCKTIVTNTGDQSMPLGDGWHPYFHLGDDDLSNWQLKIPKSKELKVDGRMIPTGERVEYGDFTSLKPIGDTKFDTGFEILEEGIVEVELFNPANGQTCKVWQNTANQGYRYVQIFIPPWRTEIAIEPMTCPANAFNAGSDVVRLAAGEVWWGEYGVR